MDRVRVTYVPRPDATLDSETATLAVVYRFILDRRAQKQDADQDIQFHTREEVHDQPLRR